LFELHVDRHRLGQAIALANERNDIDIQRRRMDASVLLVKAVGGGWNVSQLPKL
jgi:outer membrane protein TolC